MKAKTNNTKKQGKTPLYKNPNAPIEERVKDLISRMTIEEKADQLCQDTIGVDPNPDNYSLDNPYCPTCGSVYQFMGGSRNRNKFQRQAVEETRLGIPLLWAIDVIHGWRTMFPVSLAQAASFNPSLTEKSQRIAARECWQDGGIDWCLGPMVEVGHDPRWGRNVEGYGEDPYTASCFAAAAVRGFQKDGRVAACVKHFVGYSACEGGRDYSYTEFSSRALREWYLPPFAAGVEAGAYTMMSSFNEWDGKPIPANRALLTDELRTRMGFSGFVVSDCGALHRMGNMGYTSDPIEQTSEALYAGNEMAMGDGLYRNIPEAVASGKLSMETVDEAVARVLRVKFKLGCFENPYAPELTREETCILPDADDLSLKFARETMVLLKNDNKLLPLDPAKVNSIAFIGPSADEIHPHLGQWRAAAEPTPEYGETLYGVAQKFFPKATLSFARGCAGWDYRPALGDAEECEKAVEVAKSADIIMLCFGELPWMAGEIKSRRDICLPPAQRELIKALSALGKPIIGLCCSGRALAFQEELKSMDALLWLWQSGRRAPTAAMEILVGKVNPSGKLPITFPRSVGQIPIYYNCHGKITPEAHDYQDLQDEDGPWFPFGYGLAYSTYKYGKVNVKRVGKGLEASVTVKNTGKFAGKETIIWYLSDVEAKFTQPMRKVIAFEKVMLKAGETKEIILKIDPKRDLAYSLPNGIQILEPGKFILSASLQSEADFWYEE